MLHKKFLAVEADLNDLFVERNEPVRGVMVATLSRTNILLLGGAGVAKSALISQWNRRILESVYFEWLLSKFSTPEELFGPFSFTQLEFDRYVRVTKGKMPEAYTVFIDEIFKGNPSILNAMLKILNERVFYNDYSPLKLDMATVAGASNEIPDSEDGLDAFYDRFLLKYEVEHIKESGNFLKMLDTDLDREPTAYITKADIKAAQASVDRVVFPKEMKQTYIKLRDKLRYEGFAVSDRTYKVGIRLLQTQAFLNGREQIDTPDFEVFKHVVWTDPKKRKQAQSIILELIAPEKNRIYEILEMCRQAFAKVYEHKNPQKRNDEAVESLHKLKDGTKEITGLKLKMEARKADLTDVDNIELEIESMKRRLVVDEIGGKDKK